MTTAEAVATGVLGLKAGDLVEVRSAEEIRATLDENGELAGLPFMPEMLAYCGRRLTVHKVAHKLCDYISATGMRRMYDAVHLTESRCDGAAHGDCQNACSLYWKEQWLKRVDPDDPAPPTPDAGQRTLLPLLMEKTTKEPFEDGETRYSCQGTEMLRAAPERLLLKDVGQFREDVTSGNAGVLAVLKAFLIALFNRYQDRTNAFLPRWLRIRGGMRWGFLKGGVTSGRTPTALLDLQPGELVRIKSREEIMATLDGNLMNRGMGFDAEMARFCGRTARVKARANRVVDEKTGRLLTMKNPCIILEDIVCEGAFTFNCPREYVCWWREVWLERVEPEASA